MGLWSRWKGSPLKSSYLHLGLCDPHFGMLLLVPLQMVRPKSQVWLSCSIHAALWAHVKHVGTASYQEAAVTSHGQLDSLSVHVLLCFMIFA